MNTLRGSFRHGWSTRLDTGDKAPAPPLLAPGERLEHFQEAQQLAETWDQVRGFLHLVTSLQGASGQDKDFTDRRSPMTP